MAAEAAQAEVPAPPAPTAPGASPGKRVLPVPGEGGEEEEPPPPDPKRRRARVAALEGVTCPASGPGDADDSASFSFQHARGGFVVALETTPKFGSFNPPVEQAAGLCVKPASLDGNGSLDEQVPAASSACGAEDDGVKEGENSESPSSVVGVEAGCGQSHIDKNDDPVLTVDQQ